VFHIIIPQVLLPTEAGQLKGNVWPFGTLITPEAGKTKLTSLENQPHRLD
jgi:hypothetical protein